MESFHLAMMSEEEALKKVAERNAQLAAEDAEADKDDDDDRREDEE